MVESYYALYEAGETLTISGVNVNKETFGEATLITEDNYDLAPTADGGIYFIKEGITVNFTSDANIDHLVLIGDNSHKISRIHVEKQIKLLLQAEGNGHFLCKNIALDASDFSNQIFTVNSNGVYPYVAFDQCEIIPAPTKHLLYLSSAERSIDNFIIENSKFIVPTGTGENQKFLISAGSSTATYNHITIRNNVFYCQEGSIRTFAVIQGSQTTIGDITIDNNTFVNVHPATTSVVYTQEISNSVNISNNLFYMDVNEANNCIIVRATKNKDDGSGYPANGTCENNIVKRQDSSRNWQMFYGGKRPSFLTGEPLTIISANPFEGGTFDLENGIFVPNAEYAQYGASIN